MTLVLDAGALIAIERSDRATAAIIEVARREGRRVIVPAGVVAQVWRDGRQQVRLARLLGARGVDVEPLTDARARAAGSLCGATATSDVIDVSVVLTARLYRAPVVSSDPTDLHRLDATVPIVEC